MTNRSLDGAHAKFAADKLLISVNVSVVPSSVIRIANTPELPSTATISPSGDVTRPRVAILVGLSRNVVPSGCTAQTSNVLHSNTTSVPPLAQAGRNVVPAESKTS